MITLSGGTRSTGVLRDEVNSLDDGPLPLLAPFVRRVPLIDQNAAVASNNEI